MRYRQLEYHRLPTMANLALDDIDALTRADWVRLALITRRAIPACSRIRSSTWWTSSDAIASTAISNRAAESVG